MYDMAGVELNGLNPTVSKKLTEVFILPKLLHRLVADLDIKLLENFYRTTFKQNTALPSEYCINVYLLVCSLPVVGTRLETTRYPVQFQMLPMVE